MSTVTISSETHRKLKKLKNEKNKDSFEELLEELTEKELEIPSTDEMFGSAEIKDKDNVRERNDRADRHD